jgi:hypothetical protein
MTFIGLPNGVIRNRTSAPTPTGRQNVLAFKHERTRTRAPHSYNGRRRSESGAVTGAQSHVSDMNKRQPLPHDQQIFLFPQSRSTFGRHWGSRVSVAMRKSSCVARCRSSLVAR